MVLLFFPFCSLANPAPVCFLLRNAELPSPILLLLLAAAAQRTTKRKQFEFCGIERRQKGGEIVSCEGGAVPTEVGKPN